jgi:hypothetical protein
MEIELVDGAYQQVAFGSEQGDKGSGNCSYCGVRPRGFHHPGCEVEQCPRCDGQLFACDCWARYRVQPPWVMVGIATLAVILVVWSHGALGILATAIVVVAIIIINVLLALHIARRRIRAFVLDTSTRHTRA